MTDHTPPVTWTRLQRHLHWWVVAVVASQFVLQEPMRHAMRVISREESISFTQFLITTVHVWGGILALALTVYRIRQRWTRPVPVGEGRLSPTMSRVVELTHIALLLMLVIMGVSGLAHWYLNSQWAATLHESVKWPLAYLVLVHVVGALWHTYRHRSDPAS